MNKLKLIAASAALVCASLAGTAQAEAVLVHHYDFNGTLDDIYGGPSLLAQGGSLTSTLGRYDFGANQGLQLIDGMQDSAVYSTDFKVSYVSLAGSWKKLLDYRNLTSDIGIYFADDVLQFYFDADNNGGGEPLVSAGTDYHVALTRDATGTLRGYLDGSLQWEVADATDDAVLGTVLTFFIDDFESQQEEADAGSVDFIRLYSGALTDEEVRILAAGGSVGEPGINPPPPPGPNPVPEPNPLALVGLALAALGLMRRKAA